MTSLLEHARRLALACASLASAGCPSLDALECHDAGCADAATTEEAGGEGGPTSRIFCGGSSCTARAQECCVDTSGGTTCVGSSTCTGSDIFCDDPSQCPGSGACWICVNAQGFQGTSCDYQGDIVNNDHCDQTTALATLPCIDPVRGGDDVQAAARLGPRRGRGRELVPGLPTLRRVPTEWEGRRGRCLGVGAISCPCPSPFTSRPPPRTPGNPGRVICAR